MPALLFALSGLLARADSAKTPDIRLVECAPGVGNPKIGIRQMEAYAGGSGSHIHRVICVLKKLVDKATTIVLCNLALLPNILAEALWACAINVQVLASDIIEESFSSLMVSVHGCPNPRARRVR